YVNYGLGNFVWYQDRESETGVLRLRVVNDRVVSDGWVPARIHGWGRPQPLRGPARADAIADWRALVGCAGLTSRSTDPGPARG
uniref:hypothetical protein n=1 Tax=Salmonella sp. SAL4435 TaxID=3159890 RepID=UPI003979080E